MSAEPEQLSFPELPPPPRRQPVEQATDAEVAAWIGTPRWTAARVDPAHAHESRGAGDG